MFNASTPICEIAENNDNISKVNTIFANGINKKYIKPKIDFFSVITLVIKYEDKNTSTNDIKNKAILFSSNKNINKSYNNLQQRGLQAWFYMYNEFMIKKIQLRRIVSNSKGLFM